MAKKMKNSLALSIQKEMPSKTLTLQTLKEQELETLTKLLALRKRRKDLEKQIRDDEDYVARAKKFS